jgi:hypothetical protein
MSSILKTKKYKDLLAKWNKKLEKYDDCNIENYNYDEPKLKHWDNFHFKKLSADQYESRLLYYSNARALLVTGKFKRPLYRRIWELHSEGHSLREISRQLNGRISRDAVTKIVKEIIKKQMPK